MLNRLLWWWFNHKTPAQVIGSLNDPYLFRWKLIPMNRLLNVYLHLFVRSDRDVAHDHPWDNLSIILQGSYTENAYGKSLIRKPFRPIFRTAESSHRLEVSGLVWSLFITGPKRRSWGFYAPEGWIPWRKFLKIEEPEAQHE